MCLNSIGGDIDIAIRGGNGVIGGGFNNGWWVECIQSIWGSG